MLLTTILPFWYLYHRMALMDGFLTFWISLCVLFTIQLSLQKKPSWKYVPLIGISLGLAFWTKLPALFLIPALPFLLLIPPRKQYKEYLPSLYFLMCGVLLGGVIFVSLRLSPSFGQLFRRGQDFTYPPAEVLFQGKWRETLANIPSYINYFVRYLTPPIFFLSLIAVFSNRYRRRAVILILAAFLFSFPFVLFVKVIYARYLFPSALFMTITAVLSLQALYDHWFVEKPLMDWQKTAVGIVIALLVANALASSAIFINAAIFNPDQMPLVPSDRFQYLEDWSSGHGIAQTVQFIQNQAKTKKIAVATEGRFGTLPDGL